MAALTRETKGGRLLRGKSLLLYRLVVEGLGLGAYSARLAENGELSGGELSNGSFFDEDGDSIEAFYDRGAGQFRDFVRCGKPISVAKMPGADCLIGKGYKF